MSRPGATSSTRTTSGGSDASPRPRAAVHDRAPRAAFGEVALLSAGDEAAGPVAHVTMTFAVPAAQSAAGARR